MASSVISPVYYKLGHKHWQTYNIDKGRDFAFIDKGIEEIQADLKINPACEKKILFLNKSALILCRGALTGKQNG